MQRFGSLARAGGGGFLYRGNFGPRETLVSFSGARARAYCPFTSAINVNCARVGDEETRSPLDANGLLLLLPRRGMGSFFAGRRRV